MFLLKPWRPRSARPATGTCSGGSCPQAHGSPYSLSPWPCFLALLSVSQEGKARGDGKVWAPRGDLSDRPLIRAAAWGSRWHKVVRTGKPQLLIQTAMEASPHSPSEVVQMLVECQGSQHQGSQRHGSQGSQCQGSQHGGPATPVGGPMWVAGGQVCTLLLDLPLDLGEVHNKRRLLSGVFPPSH